MNEKKLNPEMKVYSWKHLQRNIFKLKGVKSMPQINVTQSHHSWDDVVSFKRH